MTGDATITFSQAGVQPPVYVVTELSGWTTLEMSVDEDKKESGDLVFSKQFSNVGEGSYQYKIRLGEHHWVLDLAKESAPDEHGYLNNVVHVNPASHHDSPTPVADATTKKEVSSDAPQHKELIKPIDNSEESIDSDVSHQLPTIPVPFVVVEKVADTDPPTYGDKEPTNLPSDTSKRAADAEPDFEEMKTDRPVEVDTPKSPEIPVLIVEKTDDKPAYGDDFGRDATSAQKVAHELRAADTSPDKLVITPEPQAEPTIKDDQAAPLFPHESALANEHPATSSLDAIDEESIQSSTDQTSSGEGIHTPSDHETHDDDELYQEPLFAHETERGHSDGELEGGPLLPHEAQHNHAEPDELNSGPLLLHEIDLDKDNGFASEDEDELDKAPLLAHENGFSDSRGSEIITNSGFSSSKDASEPRHYGPYDDDDEDDILNGEQDEAPLLPHERDTAIPSHGGSDVGADDVPFPLHGQPTFGYETNDARELFAGSGGRPNIFRTRTNSSTLPHKLPRSDEEDDNLHDPLLEQFPTSREQILERVATIGLHLPEDETYEDNLHSPQMSVLSQACSSVDLVPVKSYTSLASVPEADDSDDDEEDGDVDSLPSPILIGGSRSPLIFGRDPLATPHREEDKQLGYTEESQAGSSGNRTTESSEAESVSRSDGTKDGILSTLRDAIATPTNILNPITPPLTPERKSTTATKELNLVSNLDTELRQRRAVIEEPASTSSDATSQDATVKDKVVETVKSSLAQQTNQPNKSLLQNLVQLFSNLFNACAGDRKRASTTVLLVGGVAVTTYYVLALRS